MDDERALDRAVREADAVEHGPTRDGVVIPPECKP